MHHRTATTLVAAALLLSGCGAQDSPGGWTVAEMVRRLSRLALDMMLNGPVRHDRTMRGLEAGEWIDLSPRAASGNLRSTVVVEFGRDA